MKIESQNGPVDVNSSPFTRWKTLDLAHVSITGGFWQKRQSRNQAVSLRHGFTMLKQAGNLHNIKLAAGMENGEFVGRNFSDETVYKWLEAAAWEIGRSGDETIKNMAGEAIAAIQAAQQPDGYLNSYYQIVEPEHKFSDLDHGHELYCAGHLIQAAVAFKRAVNDDRLLQVVLRLADHIDSIFGVGKRQGACGHPEIEMALVELYRLVKEERYLLLAKFFIDQRGQGNMRGYAGYGPEYHQDHIPFRSAPELTGHAVRQMYLLAGATDLYLETGESALMETSQRLWDDLVRSKMYVTGGVGSRFDGEAFGNPYELPSDVCYCETCAAIGNLFWNWRLLLATGESRYADMIERILYNGILSCPDLAGDHFFYANPLMLRDGRYVRLSSNPSEAKISTSGRPSWHEVACCPSNVMRLFASLGFYFATRSASGLQIHQYGQAKFHYINETGSETVFRMESNYPWEGKIRIGVTGGMPQHFDLSMRIPDWCSQFSIRVNGVLVNSLSRKNGYAVISRDWQIGDNVELDLALHPGFLEPNPRIDALRGCLAIRRGPFIYCLESQDQEEGVNLLDLAIDPQSALTAMWSEDLDGMYKIEARGSTISQAGWERQIYRPLNSKIHAGQKEIRISAIPYYAWGNRGLRSMRVWIPAEK